MILRQVALAAVQLEPTRSTLFELLGIDDDFADPGVGEFGLVNSVMAIGDSFLEIVAPKEPETAAGRLLERRGDTCGYMVLMQVDSFATFDQHLNTLSLRKVWQTQRQEVSACHIHPKDMGGAIVSFDEMRPAEDWLWGGPNWRQHRAKNATRILGCEMQSPQPQDLAQRWGSIMQTSVATTPAGPILRFADGTFINFVAGDEYEGVRGFTLEAQEPRARYAQAEEMGLEIDADKDEILLGALSLRFTA